MSELDELRLRIARLDGWIFPGESEQGDIDYMLNHYGISNHPVPDYPNDIAAAWELVDEMNHSGDGFVDLIYAIHDNGPQLKWLCEFRMLSKWIVKNGNDPLDGRSDYILGLAPTAPEAICRAWLAWKEAQK
jgi:hypothetical protein